MTFRRPGTWRSNALWDRFGAGASIFCAVHCLVAPLLFLLLPTFAGIWAHPASHAIVALFVLPVAAMTLLRGYRVHQRRWIVVVAALGCIAIIVGCVLPFMPTTHAVAATTSPLASTDPPHVCSNHCPRVEIVEGQTTIAFPDGAIATLLGSVLLIVAHFGRLASGRQRAGSSNNSVCMPSSTGISQSSLPRGAQYANKHRS